MHADITQENNLAHTK